MTITNKVKNTPNSSFDFLLSSTPPSDLRQKITDAYRMSEKDAIKNLLNDAKLDETIKADVKRTAHSLAKSLRDKNNNKGRSRLVQNLLQEFSLSSEEGISLMCLAEALLRIPDKQTRDLLIKDKIAQRDWYNHIGKSKSIFVNAATWGLVITGKLVETPKESHLSSSLLKLLNKSGTPIIRKAVDYAMRLMGEQFVMGETIQDALSKAIPYEKKGYRYSYDMLGEAALTEADAKQYLLSYENAINAIGKNSNVDADIYSKAGISIKLSALYPRYERSHLDQVMDILYGRLKSLTLLAKKYNIGINIDAEESNRLELSLDLLEKLCFEKELENWNGIGFVIQAYQKRCPFVIKELIDLAKRSGHRLMVRLVKGAYWDSEIKLAQVDGQTDYPVYTRKMHTDISYLACAKYLLDAQEYIYPQFATHNAYTLSAVYHMAGSDKSYEFQCLHGMGESLYANVTKPKAENGLGVPCRIYAPVGTHETLLAYLVRRLLENGANSSFVNRISDPNISLEELLVDPATQVEEDAANNNVEIGSPHPVISLPRNLYGSQRDNSFGLDFSDEKTLSQLQADLATIETDKIIATPLVNHDYIAEEPKSVINPADPTDIIGSCSKINLDSIPNIVNVAKDAFDQYKRVSPEVRANILLKTADLMESRIPSLINILVREAGKTCNNAVAEIREAIDFLRYYSAEIKQNFNNDKHKALGVVACISPWNFPLAIFTGQIAAALAAGNSVIAKPSDQTPLIAFEAVKLFYEAGLPKSALQLVLGRGSTVGNALVSNPDIAAVCFTGSTEVAKNLHSQLSQNCKAGQEIPLIAETGGINAMIVDSSALTEQVVTNVIASAFDSAGQRCSALRILCLQEEIAEKTLTMLKGAMDELRLGDPRILSNDIGPVIDKKSQDNILQHVKDCKDAGYEIYQSQQHIDFINNKSDNSYFVAPTLVKLQNFNQLKKEIFGPVLHVITFKQSELAELIQQINASGYGLTLGLQTRIDSTIDLVLNNAEVGNMYVNRNMVGAVVGVQPFGGEKLSGTGPKAGGPLYLYRFLSDYPELTIDQIATSPSVVLRCKNQHNYNSVQKTFLAWLEKNQKNHIISVWNHYFSFSLLDYIYQLTGPTGELNNYYLSPRKNILGISSNIDDALIQMCAILSINAKVIFEKKEHILSIYNDLPEELKSSITLTDNWLDDNVNINSVIYHGSAESLPELAQKIASKNGEIISIQRIDHGKSNIKLERLFLEHSESINTAAAGGNVSLMTIDF
ncbi:trifunctional transcriptional regulator/proline dehydrogenase/L-glutamate gamma-semialdehyde dehydrogenase [Bartonella sp. DGB1]|uniref:trifunctional transcriptional regulator/proline dehydrogenase/L-glutamate gamma-semialdehyde dehydrogenase n=1 Tax=Bartonella sp. DGB1 TaxID=3239807 RepID=UPI003523D12D